MADYTVADMLVRTLAQAGVQNIWGLPGDSLNGLTESLRKQDTVAWRGVRHEEVAALAAAGEAEARDALTVCAGSCGPGNTHLINGLFEAKRAHSPMLAIAAQIPSSEVGLGYFQETHPEQLFKECSDYCELIAHPAQAQRVIETAMRTAVLERSVAVIVISGDVALSPAVEQKMQWSTPVAPVSIPPAPDLDELADLLNDSSQVAMLCGAGCAGAHDEVIALAERLKAPIVHALRGKSWLEYDNPYDVGMTGLIGFSSGYHTLKECDFLIMLGTSFPYRDFFPEHGRIVQIDLRPGHLGRRSTLLKGLVGDVKASLEALLPRLEEKTDREFLDKAQAHYRKTREDLDELAVPAAQDKPLHPQYLTARVSELAAEDAWFTAEVGTPTVWAARYLKMNGRRRLSGSFMHGSMATAMPQAMGIQSAEPGRQVISLSGDGGINMLMGDLMTLAEHRLPVKVIVYNNETLGFVAMEMKAAGYVDEATNLPAADYARIAEAMGIKGIRVRSSEALDGALQEAFAHDGPVIVDVSVAKQELSMPPSIEAAQAKGFSLYMLRAVMSGKGDEVMDLANTNWLSRVFKK